MRDIIVFLTKTNDEYVTLYHEIKAIFYPKVEHFENPTQSIFYYIGQIDRIIVSDRFAETHPSWVKSLDGAFYLSKLFDKV